MSIGSEGSAGLGLSVRSRSAAAQVAGLPPDPWAVLQQLGVGTLELTLPERPDEEDFFTFSGELLDRGFRLSFHSPYPDALDLREFTDGRDPVGDYYRVWLSRMRDLAARLGGAVLVLHGVNAPGVEAEVIARARATTSAFIRWLADEVHRRELNLRLALEVRPRREGWTKVGTTCAEVLALEEEAAPAGLGICWDVGHSIMNLARGHDGWPPTPEFLRRTIHTHFHLATAERDHLPLSRPDPLLKEALRLLAGAGYRGALTLECLFADWEGVLRSVELLGRLLSEAKKHAGYAGRGGRRPTRPR